MKENKKVVLVTGASRGIGRAIAKLLSNEGYIVIANYNKSEDAAESLKNELIENGKEIEIYKADVSKRDEVEKMVEYIINKYGTIDVLVNNAGIDLVKLFTDVSDEDWNYVINTNLYSTFVTSQSVVKEMINKKAGGIINISSIFGIIGASCESIYSVSKAGMDALTKSLAKELALSNIRVNSIAPGLIDTDMNNDLSEEDIKNIEKEIPLGRIGNEYITGQIIEVNGGWHM